MDLFKVIKSLAQSLETKNKKDTWNQMYILSQNVKALNIRNYRNFSSLIDENIHKLIFSCYGLCEIIDFVVNVTNLNSNFSICIEYFKLIVPEIISDKDVNLMYDLLDYFTQNTEIIYTIIKVCIVNDFFDEFELFLRAVFSNENRNAFYSAYLIGELYDYAFTINPFSFDHIKKLAKIETEFLGFPNIGIEYIGERYCFDVIDYLTSLYGEFSEEDYEEMFQICINDKSLNVFKFLLCQLKRINNFSLDSIVPINLIKLPNSINQTNVSFIENIFDVLFSDDLNMFLVAMIREFKLDYSQVLYLAWQKNASKCIESLYEHKPNEMTEDDFCGLIEQFQQNEYAELLSFL